MARCFIHHSWRGRSRGFDTAGDSPSDVHLLLAIIVLLLVVFGALCGGDSPKDVERLLATIIREHVARRRVRSGTTFHGEWAALFAVRYRMSCKMRENTNEKRSTFGISFEYRRETNY